MNVAQVPYFIASLFLQREIAENGPFWTQKMLRSAVETSIGQMVPISRIYTLPHQPKLTQLNQWSFLDGGSSASVIGF